MTRALSRRRVCVAQDSKETQRGVLSGHVFTARLLSSRVVKSAQQLLPALAPCVSVSHMLQSAANKTRACTWSSGAARTAAAAFAPPLQPAPAPYSAQLQTINSEQRCDTVTRQVLQWNCFTCSCSASSRTSSNFPASPPRQLTPNPSTKLQFHSETKNQKSPLKVSAKAVTFSE